MNILRFETNTPVQVALKFDGGRDVDGRYGPQVLYTLADGRLMYLEPKAARRIDELKITAGEPSSIRKREASNGSHRVGGRARGAHAAGWRFETYEAFTLTKYFAFAGPPEQPRPCAPAPSAVRVSLTQQLSCPPSFHRVFHPSRLACGNIRQPPAEAFVLPRSHLTVALIKFKRLSLYLTGGLRLELIRWQSATSAQRRPAHSSDTRLATRCASRLMISGQWPSPFSESRGNSHERVLRHAEDLRR